MICTYDFYLPILFGVGAVTELGNKVKEFGCKKVMIVCDGGVKAAGLSEKAEASLKMAEIEFITYDKITSDPTDKQVDDAGNFARQEKVEAVIGIGGGSSMDAAKAISLLIEYEPPISNYMNMPADLMECSVPVILIPTTSGTGSEATTVGVISSDQFEGKKAIARKNNLVILDPELTVTAPAHVTAFTGIDALTHAIEAITCKMRNPFSEVIALAAISKIIKYLPIAYKDGSNIEARSNMALGSNWAGIAMENCLPQIGHAMADAIGVNFPVPHGVACAQTVLGTIHVIGEALPDKTRLIGKAMGLEFADEELDESVSKKIEDFLREFIHGLGIKSLKEMGITREELVETWPVVAYNGVAFQCPKEVTPDFSKELLGWVYDNYQ